MHRTVLPGGSKNRYDWNQTGVSPDAMQMQPWFPSGLKAVPHVEWGSHLAHFFGSGTELRDVLVPYFKVGLENNERCFWLTGRAFNAEQARSTLRAAVPDLDKRERDKQIEIANGDEWYATGGKPRPQDLVDGLLQPHRTRSCLVTRVSEQVETAPGWRRINGRIFWNTKGWFRRLFATGP